MWQKYRKTILQEMRDYIPGEDLTGVSVAPGETPKEGGKIAKDQQGSRWYVSPEFMSENYELVADCAKAPSYPWHGTESDKRPSKEEIFVRHIESHLEKGQEVICKICGKTIDQIADI